MCHLDSVWLVYLTVVHGGTRGDAGFCSWCLNLGRCSLFLADSLPEWLLSSDMLISLLTLFFFKCADDMVLVDSVPEGWLVFNHRLGLWVASMAVGGLEGQTSCQSLIRLKWVDSLAWCTLAVITCVSKLGLVYGAVIFATMLTTARELLHPLVSAWFSVTLLGSRSLEITSQWADSGTFRASIPLVMEITLPALTMVD